mmetsp:Transcript_28716/g.72026  ORF Transcript_28716/g.72026 Transcript_28716/m.72026 type:complete len:136 (-) Transcript_28716:167-574(-)
MRRPAAYTLAEHQQGGSADAATPPARLADTPSERVKCQVAAARWTRSHPAGDMAARPIAKPQVFDTTTQPPLDSAKEWLAQAQKMLGDVLGQRDSTRRSSLDDTVWPHLPQRSSFDHTDARRMRVAAAFSRRRGF